MRAPSLALVFSAAFFFSVQAQVIPRLDLVKRLPTGEVELKLIGAAGTNYTIDASENLTTWFSLRSGIATNGELAVRHDGASNFAALFYRGKVAITLLPPVTVGLRPDTNTTLSALVSINGATSQLIGADGTRYSLTLPSNSIPDARILTLTEITNFTGLPFARRPIGAIKIEPGDLMFWGAATLEITFRTNIDRRQIASFACQPDGTGFQLMYDRVGTNRILIPVTRAGVYGSVVTTIPELEEIAQHEVAASPALAAKSVLHAFAGVECQAARKAAAEAVRQQLSQALAAKGQALASKVGIERQKQLLGATDDSTEIMDELVAATCEFYSTQIAPRWPEAARNCALGKVLTQFTLGLARQMALLGGGEDTCVSMGNIAFCVMFDNCLEEIRECCDAGNRGAVKVSEVLGLMRQDALLGLNCISEAKAQAVIDACSSNIWTGTYSVQASAHTNITVSDKFSTSIQIDDLDSRFSGSVIESTEHGTEATGYIVQLRVAGQISVDDYSSHSVDIAGECGRRFTQESGRVVAAAPTEYMVSFTTRPDGTYVLFTFNRTDTTFGAPAIETNIELEITQSCEDGSERVKNKTTTEPSGVVGYSLPFYQGTWTDPNAITGEQNAIDTGHDPDNMLNQKYSFSRRKAP